MIRDDQAGRQATCPCGRPFMVPKAALVRADVITPAQGAKTPDVTGSASNNLTIQCQHCQRQLLVPASALGKAVTCRCGKLVMVKNEPDPADQPAPISDFLSRLPLSQQTQQSTPVDGPEFWYVNSDQPDIIVEGRFVMPTRQEEAVDYLDNAEQEIKRQRLIDSQNIDHSVIHAQWVMVVFGLYMACLYGYLFLNVENVHTNIIAAGNPTQMSPDELMQHLTFTFGSRLAIGIGLITCGALTQFLPQVFTLAGLALCTLPQLLTLIITLATVPDFFQRNWQATQLVGLSVYAAVIAVLLRGAIGANNN
jgi:hypothetical protein